MVRTMELSTVKMNILQLAVILSVAAIVSPEKLPILACHVPLDAELIDVPQGLEACSHIILSTSNPLFLPHKESSMSPEWEKEKFALDLVHEKIPDAHFIFSLRAGSVNSLGELFNATSSLNSLKSFLNTYNFKSFDIAWELVQPTKNASRLLKGLRTTLVSADLGITSTLGYASGETLARDFSEIFPLIDLLFLVPNGNSFYSTPFSERPTENELTFDYLEMNEGSILNSLPLSESNRDKIVIGLSLQALIWKVNSESLDLPDFPRYAKLEIQPYAEVCNRTDNEWTPLRQQTSPYYTVAKQFSAGEWMILVDPASLSNRIKLLMRQGFAGVTLYDYDMDDHEGRCGETKSPLIVEASVSVGSDVLYQPADPLNSSEMCVPFLGLDAGCNKAGHGEREPAETSATGTYPDGEISPSESYLASVGYTTPDTSEATLIETVRTSRSADETQSPSTEMTPFMPVTDTTASLAASDNVEDQSTSSFDNEKDEYIEGSSPTDQILNEIFESSISEDVSNDNTIELAQQEMEGSGETYGSIIQATLHTEQIISSTAMPFLSHKLQEDEAGEADSNYSTVSEGTGGTAVELSSSTNDPSTQLLTESNGTNAPEVSSTMSAETLDTTPTEQTTENLAPESDTTALHTSHVFSEPEPSQTPDSSISDDPAAVSTTEITEDATATYQSSSALELHDETESSEIASFMSSSLEFIESETSAFATSSTTNELQSPTSSSSPDELSNDSMTTSGAAEVSSVPTLLSSTPGYDGLIGDSANSHLYSENNSHPPSTMVESDNLSYSNLAPATGLPSSDISSSTQESDLWAASTLTADITSSRQSTAQPLFESTTSRPSEEIAPEATSFAYLASTEDSPYSTSGHPLLFSAPTATSTNDYLFHNENFKSTDYETYALSALPFASEVSFATPERVTFEVDSSSQFEFPSGTTGQVISWSSSSSEDESSTSSSDSLRYETSTIKSEITWPHRLGYSHVTADSIRTVTAVPTEIIETETVEQEEVLHEYVTTSSSPRPSSPLWSGTTKAQPIRLTTIEDNEGLPAFSINGEHPSHRNCTAGSSDCPNAAVRHSVSLSAGDVSNSVIIQVNVHAHPSAVEADNQSSDATRWLDSVVQYVDETDGHFGHSPNTSSDLCSFAGGSFLLKLLLCPRALVSTLKDAMKEVVPDIVADLAQSLNRPASNTYQMINNVSPAQKRNETDDIYETTTQSKRNDFLTSARPNYFSNSSSSNYDDTMEEKLSYTFNVTFNTSQVIYETGISEEQNNVTIVNLPASSQSLSQENEALKNQTEPGSAYSEVPYWSFPQNVTLSNSTDAMPAVANPSESRNEGAAHYWNPAAGSELRRKAGLAVASLPVKGRQWRTIPIKPANFQLYRSAMSPSAYKKKSH